ELRGAVGLVAVAECDRSGYGRGGRVGAERSQELNSVIKCGMGNAECQGGRRVAARPPPSIPHSAFHIPHSLCSFRILVIACRARGDSRRGDTLRGPPQAAVERSSAPCRRTCPFLRSPRAGRRTGADP